MYHRNDFARKKINSATSLRYYFDMSLGISPRHFVALHISGDQVSISLLESWNVLM
jgi:hypothetical protein